jgi:hypothetical protein
MGSVSQFLSTPHSAIIQHMQAQVTAIFGPTSTPAKISAFNSSQHAAWVDELKVLAAALQSAVTTDPSASQWELVLEYELPQQGGRRPDVVVLAGNSVVVLEFKMKPHPTIADIDQLDDYVRDIKFYHTESHKSARVCGALVATLSASDTTYGNVTSLCPSGIASFLLSSATPGQMSIVTWVQSGYTPAPGLLNAAIQGWFNNSPTLPAHLATNLPIVETALQKIIATAVNDLPTVRRLVIVTGEPGAGKTFLGLKLAHDSTVPGTKRFVSGNGPLVRVLNYVLKQHQQIVTALHKFRDHYSSRQDPSENIIIFDEAQRTLDATYMRERFKVAHSEAHLMLDITTRTPGWGVLVLLVGTGQEIYKGEVGLRVWFDELAQGFPNTTWEVHCSVPHVACLNSNATTNAVKLPPNVRVHNAVLHLNTALRQHGALDYSKWVEAVLSGDSSHASLHASQSRNNHFKLYVTRNLHSGKVLLQTRYQNDPTKRYGLLAVSGNETFLSRHRVSAFPRDGSIERWYVDPQGSADSGCSFNHAVSEFQCQGLDLDATIVCWGQDLKWDNITQRWVIKPVSVKPPVPNPVEMRLNKYRVILTRAREYAVIFIPGDPSLDDTSNFLVASGATPLP